MKLVALAALIAVCGAAKLDRTYLPPASAATAGGNHDSLQTPITRTSEQGDSSANLPTGSYTNSFQGVIVDAAGAGTRATPDDDQSGLGGPRDTYGSQNSKVGDAAFRESIAGFRSTPFSGSGFNGQVSGINAGLNFGSFELKSERPQAFKDRNSNIISYANDVSLDNYSYGFESDNGIAIGENGVANNGIQAQGGYSYQGDDGQVYKVTYVADEGGYRPQGDHLPTPPPIPKEILESLEQNAKDEAAGLIDDGSYDAQKYNAEGDYTPHNAGNIQYNGAQLSQFAKRPESDATASNTFINQNSQAFGKPTQFGNPGAQNTQSNFNSIANQFGSTFASNQNGLAGSQNQESSQALTGHQGSSLPGHQGSEQLSQTSSSQFGQAQSTFGSHTSQFLAQNAQQTPVSPVGTQQSYQFTSQTNQQESGSHSVGHSSQFGSQVHQQSGSTSHLNGQVSQGSAPSFGAQPNRPNFGTNSAFNSQQNQFGNQALKPQGSFGAAEYLPPFNANKRPSYTKPQTNEVSASQHSSNNNQSPNFVPLGAQNQGSTQGSSTSTFASVGSAGFQPQTSQTLNGFQHQPSRPNQFISNYGQTVSNVSPTSLQHSGSHAAPGFSTAAKPTSIPSIELTTPLEPNETPGYTQGSQPNTQSNPNFENIGFQSINNQAKPQTGFQNGIASNQQSTSQTSTSSFVDSRPQGSSQFDSTSPAPAAFPTTQRPGTNEEKPQNTQSSLGQIQLNNYYSTQKPAHSQGPDDSYYYNQPSKPFGTHVARPQGSRFPSTPSYQPNGVVSSQNNQLLNQQGSQSQSNFNNLPNSGSVVPAAPTTTSQFTQTQASLSTNGITQASISPFPSVSPTTSAQYDTTQAGGFGSKPNVSSFPSRPAFGQNPSTSFTQNQIEFGQSSLSNNNLPSASQSVPSKPSIFGQTATSSFTQSQTQFGPSSTNNDQTQNPEKNQEQGATSSQTQEYEGTVYEYNKPPEVLPTPEQDGSSSQNMQTDSSLKPQTDQKPNSQEEAKPQFGSQQTQFGQSSFSSQQSSSNHGTKPQSGSHTYKPFGGAQSTQTQFSQNTQSTSISQQNTQGIQGTTQPAKPNESVFSSTNQYSQNQQTGLGSRPQFGSQPAKPFGSVSSTSQLGQNLQQQTTQNGVQSFKPFGGAQFGQNTQNSFGSITHQQNSGSQFSAQANKPVGSASIPSQFGQVSQNQGSHANGFISTQNSQTLQNDQQPFGTTGSIQSVQPAKPIGTSGSQSFQGYPSSKPQFGNQLTLPQFTQTSQQTFGATQPQATVPTKPFGSQPSIHGSPDSLKPQFGQNTQLNQGTTQPLGSSFGQQSVQTSQFGSASKPQFGAHSQFDQNQNAPNKPFGSTFSQAQFGQNSAQASSSLLSQPSGVQAYKPFASSFSSNFQYQNKPQSDQAPQSSAVSTTSAPSQIGGQPFGTAAQGSPSQVSQSHSVPCCKSVDKDSAIAPLNVGKPSQAFAQTQSQFTGFQGAQGFNTQSLAGKGEEFGGPRQPPSFDAQSGYHY